MNFLRLSDNLLTVLFEDDDIIAIDKPYGFNAHTNDSKIEHSEFIQDGLIEIYEKQRKAKLHIIHRLDQTTTGVMIFGKSADSAKKYAEFFFDRKVKKTYWFLTKSSSKENSFSIDQEIIHKAKELDAKTNLTLLKKEAGLELWQANPLTGRNHQIRIHAQAAVIPILGDAKYKGAHFPFLCLHNHKIEFPNGIKITSKPPVYFENPKLLEDQTLAKTFFEIDRRQRLFGDLSNSDKAFRLAIDKNFSLDQLADTLALNWHRENWGAAEIGRFTLLAETLNKPILVRFNKSGSNSAPVVLSPKANGLIPWTASENKMRFEYRSDAGSVGVPTNQRLLRSWLLENANGKMVLNLFSGLGGYGVAAALGKAKQVTSVETGKSALGWSKKNFELNHLSPENFMFLCRDSLSYLEQCQLKKTKFDLIVFDCPAFFRREKGVFKIEKDLGDLLKKCLSVLEPKGQVLFSTNFDQFFIEDVQKIIMQTKKSLKIDCILQGLDFELPDEKAELKSFLISN